MLGRRKFMFRVASCLAITSSGCGTILHSERIGRPHSNDLDWKVVALDGLGLMLFFVPGVVAFAVDFYNGSIYLPGQSSRSTAHNELDGQNLLSARHTATMLAGDSEAYDPGHATRQFHRVKLPDERLTMGQVETVVSEQLGLPLCLLPDHTRVSKLASLDRFSQQCEIHRNDIRFGLPLKNLLARKNREQRRPGLS